MPVAVGSSVGMPVRGVRRRSRGRLGLGDLRHSGRLLAISNQQSVSRCRFYFPSVPHINNRPLKTVLSHAKLKLNRRVGRWRKPVLAFRWPVVRSAESWLLHVRTTTSFA
jgi:hypothetical protein